MIQDKQIKYLFLLLALGMTTACSDDDNDDKTVEAASVITLDNDLTTHGVETDMQSAVVDVPVQCDGLWTATLPTSADWVQILDWKVTYNGNQTLRLAFDENHTKADRSTTLKLGNNYGQFRTITVRQNYNYKGEAPSNGEGLAFANRGIGMGINYDYALNVAQQAGIKTVFDPTTVHLPNNIFNLSRIEELMEQGELQSESYDWAVFIIETQESATLDDCLKKDEFGLTMATPFGVVAGRTLGDYCTTVQASRNYVDYTVVRNIPTSRVSLAPSVIAEYAAKHRQIDEEEAERYTNEIKNLEDMYKTINWFTGVENLNENGLTEEQQEDIDTMYAIVDVNYDHAGIYSTTFKRIYNQLYAALVYSDGHISDMDAVAVEQAMAILDEDYGPFFISHAEFGGSLTMYCQVNTSLLDGADSFTENLAEPIEALLSTDGNPSYSEDASRLLRNMNVSLSVYGGNATAALNGLQQTLISGSADDVAKWPSLMRDWRESVFGNSTEVEDIVGNGAPIKFSFTPIWTLFAEEVIRDYVKNYFVQKYGSHGINGYIDIWNGTQHPTANELLNTSSSFWK